MPKEGDSDQVFSLMRRDVALDGKDKKKPKAKKSPEPTEPSQPKANIPVRVQNGTGTSLQRPITGRAGAVAALLTRKGFGQAASDSTPKSQADSTITYPSERQKGDALAVAKAWASLNAGQALLGGRPGHPRRRHRLARGRGLPEGRQGGKAGTRRTTRPRTAPTR